MGNLLRLGGERSPGLPPESTGRGPRNKEHALSTTSGTRLCGTVRYDGTNFAGWQVQPGQRTVQGVIEAALSRIAREPVRVEGAGRTDAGVHALGQVFSFTWPGEADAARLRRAVSSLAGPDAQVTRLEEAPPGFHARYSATGKRYAYVLHLSREPDPLLARYAWTIDARADTEAVADLARRFVGTHDFGGVQGSGAGAATTVRTVHSIELRRGAVIGPCDAADVWRLDFYGTGFLYKMIRNITGALVEVARNKLPEARLDELLAGPGPYRGRTAPGHGLTLLEVAYGEQRKKEALRMGP